MQFLPTTVFALTALLAVSTEAFVPHSTFTAKNNGEIGAASVKVQAFVPVAAESRRLSRGADVSLNMGNILVDMHNMFVLAARPDLALTDRLVRIAKANMEKNMKQAQRKRTDEGVLNDALQEMQNDLIKIKQAYDESIEMQRRVMMQKRQAEQIANDWYRRAEGALRRGYKESIVKNALAERQKYLTTAKNLQDQLDAQAAATKRLAEGMQAMDDQFREAYSKRGELLARAKTAESVKKVNELLNGMTKSVPFKALDRLEEKVEMMEAEAEESTEETFWASAPLDAKLEMDFMNLEASAAIQDEYKKLKEQSFRKRRNGMGNKTDAEIARDLRVLEKELLESGTF